MKKVVIPEQPKKQPEIDWNKPQWVIFEDPFRVILTTGQHEKFTFTGTCMPCKDYPNGDHDVNWTKSKFQPLTFDIPFTISNDND
jgi:hypothetical protein